MRIAVTYENGQIFQHFGRCEAFKIYEVEDNKIVSSEVVGTNGVGHEALAGFLNEKGVAAVICGGMGAGMQGALEVAGIVAISGIEGDADEAVAALLNGELTSAGVNCDHHDGEEEEEGCNCGEGCGSSCGGGCGGCGGGCGGSQYTIVGPNAGKTVKVHYTGTLNDGTKFDSSYDRGEPLEFVCGVGMMILGFDSAVADMEVGQIIDVHLTPEEAYGPFDPNAVFTVQLDQLPGAEGLNVGERVVLRTQYGQPVPVTVKAKDDTSITFDANHEMAGKELNFRIELLEAK